MKVKNVLIFPAGTEIGLEIYHALEFCKEVKLFSAGKNELNHAQYISTYYNLPCIYEENWLEELVDLCKKLSIDYIFPAYDEVIVALSKNRSKIPATVIAPSAALCELTRSKSKTYAYLKETVRVPRLYETPKEVVQYPVFIKPNQGQGSVGAKKIFNKSELLSAIKEEPTSIICEYLPGEEYTVDCFSDREQGLLFAGARVRRRVRNGISINTETIDLPEARVYAQKLSERLALHGAWFFQVKRDSDGALALLEVAPRISGSMAAHRVQGINFPLLSIYEHERAALEILTNAGAVQLDRALENRYKHNIQYNVLYIGLANTLIINSKINTEAIRLIFNCINKNKKVVLVTRDHDDLSNTLTKYKLLNLFDHVINVLSDQKTSECISDKDAIFVDDSFSERTDVALTCGIPTFNASMIELISRD